jgi:hypothetical protein
MASKPFLIPIFFKKDVLSEFKSVSWSTDYLGTIEDDGANLVFGITPKGYVSIWIGDFAVLDDLTREKLVPYYVEVDHIGLHFYRSQVKAEFVKKDDPNQ